MKSSGKASPVNVSAAAAAPSTSGMAGVYHARQSNKTAGMHVAHDGVVWKERLAVVEGVTTEGNPKLHIRSYFRNPMTRERVWDEPPSGASGVDFSTTEMRQQAEEQMRELQFTLDLIPPDQQQQQEQQESPVKKGLFGRLKNKKKGKVTLKDDSKDLNLQRAIALSMTDQHGGGNTSTNDPRILFDSEFSEPVKTRNTAPASAATTPMATQEEEDLAMAKALSLSAENNGPATKNMTEEEILQLAIQQSEEEMHSVPQQKPVTTAEGAQPSFHKRSPTPTEKIGAFDPYSPHISPSTRSSTPTTETSEAVSSQHRDHLHKMDEQEQNDRKKPGRSLSRRMFGGRKRMEAQAGIL